jgi:hypothetical protein
MPANYVLLETVYLTQSASSVTIDNIPQSGYTDLKVVVSARADGTTGNFFEIRPNGATTNLSGRYLQGDGSATNSSTFQPWSYIPPSNSTASTFGSVDIYIPNYSSTSINKSISVDYVTENNAATAYAGIEAGLWASTSAITSLVFAMSTGNFVANSTFSLYGLAAVGTTPVIAPKASGGNIVANDGTYWYHAFLSTAAFVPNQALTCDYLVVAGGGSGSGGNGMGGGGAGGLRSTVTTTGGGGSLESAIAVAANTSYTVTVGAGGASAIPESQGYSGSNSAFSTITATGGGAGGYYGNASTGGSGGGSSRGGNAGSGTTNQGYAGGGSANSGNYGTGGGGGAGAVGGTGTTSVNGNGGNGVTITALATPTLTGVSGAYAGGGGGGVTYDGSFKGGNTSGGTGGGGGSNTTTATAGTINTGSGGGGGGGSGGNAYPSGAGGSGIVIIRYPIA